MVRSRLFMESYLARIPHAAPLLLCFGEVDRNSRIPFRMFKHKTTADKEIQDSVDAYAIFLDELVSRRKAPLIVYAPHPPCQRKDKPTKERRLWLNLKQRMHTHTFNRRLNKLCSNREFLFLSLESMLIDPETRLVHEKFLRRSKTNHHLKHETLAPVLHKALLNCPSLRKAVFEIE